MSAQGATIGFAGSTVRRSHLIAVGILLVLAVAAGIIAGRATTTDTPRSVVLPVSGLADPGVGSKVFPAMNGLTVAPTEHLSGYSQALRVASGRA